MSKQRPALLQHLEDDHQHIAQVLKVLESELAKYDDDRVEPDLDLVMSVIDYISAYPDAIHHPLEDLLFERLLEDDRMSEDERALIRLNVAEHHDIIAATQSLAADMQRIFNDGVVPIERLKQDLNDYVQTQFVHMRREQEQLFPLAENHLTKTEWQALEEQSPIANDPLFGQLEEQYESLLGYITN
jgi:hemerythrin-like domain-containing protein